ncbi:hypothetical protein [Halodesulfurarchaeum formicicum]|uniref:Uncharacterized protein n=1 Tax=Halodesulfurarchaeum formicicum TaxID=1873524 RepID=A0A1J1ABI7_9EURY|nr:hypothetical protein [Halodesulfurarchaeum formicicum]APE95160.1 hypothetical protein HSR6_0701 [Halodesulfurarchaeum formicicum]
MSLSELTADVESAYAALDDAEITLDGESKMELAMLQAALEEDDPATLVRRGIHMLFQSTTETGKLDFHLRGAYDVTYDEYLSGMTYEEMTGGTNPTSSDDDRRYQF